MVTALLLLVLSGFVSASETSFFSLSPDELKRLSEDDSFRGRKASALLSDSERLLATILTANNLVNVAIILLLDLAFSQMLVFGAEWVEFVVLTVILTFILLLFGEIIPKLYSAHNSLSFSLRAAPLLSGLSVALHPVTSLLMRSRFLSDYVQPKKNFNISVDQLEHALELTDSHDIADEQEMLEGVIRFGDETVVDIMTSRIDMIMLDIKATYKDVMKCIGENFYSRVPVYSGTSDNIKGILYIKDLLPYLEKGDGFRWQSLIRPAFFVPETRKVDDLLHDFQTGRIHMAIVVDEFGGTSGLVTLEDVIEEILGEINDEFDDDSVSYRKTGPDTYVFEGKTLLSDFFRIVGLDEEDYSQYVGEADTLAGFLLELKGDFPKKDEELVCKDLKMRVMEKKERRISGIRVAVLNK
ncbi:MAG: gliding motility-associated protein GldE [Bacteroidaceae bacterium]|jgi:gliding motility-associated protein GldE|nr:gliding motility-associated protein GldE [Bacteroidaceae bacterium]